MKRDTRAYLLIYFLKIFLIYFLLSSQLFFHTFILFVTFVINSERGTRDIEITKNFNSSSKKLYQHTTHLSRLILVGITATLKQSIRLRSCFFNKIITSGARLVPHTP